MAAEKRVEPATNRPRASIAGPIHRTDCPHLCATQKAWKAPPADPFHTHFPQLWRLVLQPTKSLQIAVIVSCGRGEKSSLRRFPHAAMLATPWGREKEHFQA